MVHVDVSDGRVLIEHERGGGRRATLSSMHAGLLVALVVTSLGCAWLGLACRTPRGAEVAEALPPRPTGTPTGSAPGSELADASPDALPPADAPAPGLSPSGAPGALQGTLYARTHHPVGSQARQLRGCYEEGLARNPKLAGRLTVKFVIERDGGVSHVQQEGEPFPDPRVVACVLTVFQKHRFPRPEGGQVTVVYPIVFSTGD